MKTAGRPFQARRERAPDLVPDKIQWPSTVGPAYTCALVPGMVPSHSAQAGVENKIIGGVEADRNAGREPGGLSATPTARA